MANKETFCSYPFDSLFLETGGTVKPCCTLRDTMGNIKDKPLKEILEGGVAREIRESITKGEWHPLCFDCKLAESKGMQTQRSSEEVQNKFEVMKDIIHPDYFELHSTDIRWNNTCNLSCTYCAPHFSSQWANAKKDTKWKQKKDAPELLIEYLEEHRDTYKEAHLLGGEPLLLKPNLKLIETFPDIQYSVLSNFSVPLQTNKIAQKLLTLPNVRWQVSFETIGKRFEYVRNGGDWYRFESNIKYIYEQTGKKILVFPTYCVYPALHLDEFCDYIYDSPYFSDNVIWTGLVHPHQLDITLQSPAIKRKALDELDKVLAKRNIPEIHAFREGLLPTLNKPRHADITMAYHNQIEKWLKKDITLKDVFPDLYEDLVR